jgi:hypothetical protein
VTTFTLTQLINEVRINTKLPNTTQVTDATIVGYLNVFVTQDFPQRIQDLSYKSEYQFVTVPFVDKYNLPMGGATTGNTPTPQPVPPNQTTTTTPSQYLQMCGTVWLAGSPIQTYQDPQTFANNWSLNMTPAIPVSMGNGGSTYSWTGINFPILRGFTNNQGNLYPGLWISTVSTNGTNLLVTDDGFGNLIGDCVTGGTVNYLTGAISVTFTQTTSSPIIQNNYTFSAGQPSCVLFYNNTFVFRNVPDQNYLVQVPFYANPAAFINAPNTPIIFPYMFKYFVYGTSRYILRETKDRSQLEFIEPLFREQEIMLLTRTTRQDDNARVQTIYNAGWTPIWQTNNPATGM